MMALDWYQALPIFDQYTGKGSLQGGNIWVNKIIYILVSLLLTVWQISYGTAAANNEKPQNAPLPGEASVAFDPISAKSILANGSDDAFESPVYILELNLSKADFDDETYVGDVTLWGFTLALAPNPRYQFGYSYLTNSHIFGDWDPSLDEGPEVASNENFDISSSLLYFRYDWPIDNKLGVFALIGYSRVELETRLTEICFLVCGELIEVSEGEIKYKNKDSAFSLGIGIQLHNSSSTSWTLRYVNQSSSDFEFRSIRLDFNIRG